MLGRYGFYRFFYMAFKNQNQNQNMVTCWWDSWRGVRLTTWVRVILGGRRWPSIQNLFKSIQWMLTHHMCTDGQHFHLYICMSSVAECSRHFNWLQRAQHLPNEQVTTQSPVVCMKDTDLSENTH